MADAGTLVNTTQNYVDAYSGAATNFSGTNDLSPGMKTFYRTVMLENARDALVFAQLGRKQPLPAHEGKIVEWRKWNTLPDADTLTEGVIPEGKKFGQTAMNVALTQQGLYVAITDQLDTHHVDNVHLGATEEVGASIGRSYDKLVRLALQQSTNILYADAVDLSTGAKTPVTSRDDLNIIDTAYSALTPDTIHQAMTILRKANAPTYDGSNYVAVVHPSVLYDLMSTKDWIDYHKYEASTDIFNGEVGKLFGVRFISTSLAPIVRNTGDTLSVYQTFVFGKEAFAVVNPDGAGIETIIHDRTSGIGGPLNQFGTVGGKFSGAAKILYQERMVTIESTGKYSDSDVAN